jgi:phosphohistidine phosphatase SixA
MQKIIRASLIFLFSFSISSYAANLGKDLKDGQHILMMRHADAPGFGDPPGYQLDQCSSQRNLGDLGKKQSVAIGKWLSSQGINGAMVFSSPWCRCIDTAKLINQGPVNIEKSLGSFFDDMSLEKSQTRQLSVFIKNTLKQYPNKPLILVTHHVNIQAYTGKIVNVGDMVLVKVNADGQYHSHQYFPSPNPSN